MKKPLVASHGLGELRTATTMRLFASVALLVALCGAAGAEEAPPPAEQVPQIDVRDDGVLAESFGYHRRPVQPPSIMPPEGAYRYGFPVQSYRWGWFGAEHYYPYVVWHRGYNRDCVRWGYRWGY